MLELRPPNTTATRGLRDGESGLWGRFSVLISRRAYPLPERGYSARNAVRGPNGGGRRPAVAQRRSGFALRDISSWSAT